MKDNIKTATEFAEQIKKTPHIRQIVLFGSVARGEDTVRSDIDIAIIHDSNDSFALMGTVNKNKPDSIQTTFVHIKKLSGETELVGALTGDGILLYGSPITITAQKAALSPKVIIAYSLAKLPQTEKVKTNRALYGATSKVSVGKKTYTTETKGVVNEPGIEKLAKGVLLIDRKKAAKVKGILRHFHAAVKEIPAWTY